VRTVRPGCRDQRNAVVPLSPDSAYLPADSTYSLVPPGAYPK
jgi:hypothetical protein